MKWTISSDSQHCVTLPVILAAELDIICCYCPWLCSDPYDIWVCCMTYSNSRSYQICKSPFSLWKLRFTFEYFTEICTFNHGFRLVFPCVRHPFLELNIQLWSSSHAEDSWDLCIFHMQRLFFFFLSSYLYINRSETQINGCVQIIKDCKRGQVKGHFPWVVESQYGT